MSPPNPALQPVTLTLSAHELEVVMLALIHLLPALRFHHDVLGNMVDVGELVHKLTAQRLANPAHPEPAP